MRGLVSGVVGRLPFEANPFLVDVHNAREAVNKESFKLDQVHVDQGK
jgi:hypothetical protein